MARLSAQSKLIVCLGSVALATLAASASAQAGSASFTGLGFLNPSYPSSTNPYVDADGTVVAGTSTYDKYGDTEAVVWTQSGGMVGLGFLKDRTAESEAGAISGNGQMIGGFSEKSGSEQAFYWTQATGVEPLNDDRVGLGVYGLNKNGSYMAGTSDIAQAFLWVKGKNKAQALPSLGGDYDVSGVKGMDSTGKYIAGVNASTTNGQTEAVIWNDGNVSALGFPPGDSNSGAYGISGDSTMVVGFGENDSGSTAFYWTTGSGIQVLSAPSALPYTMAQAVDNTGTAIVGCAFASGGAGEQAILWNSKLVPKTLASLAAQYGLDITGWTLTCATSVSANGKIIVGNGTDPDGHNEAWILQLP